jgi:hypothetical protein
MLVTLFYLVSTMRFHRLKSLSAIAMARFISQGAPATTINTYLMAGQSNRMGVYDTHQQLPADRCVVLYPELAIAAANQLDMTRAEYPPGDLPDAPRWAQIVKRMPHTLGPVSVDASVRGGPDIQFGRLLYAKYGAAHNTTIAKFAVGGSSLRRHWMQSKSVDLSSRMLMFLAELKAKIEASGNTFVLRSFHWLQGETDGTVQADANHYFDNLTGLIAKVRSFAGNPALPVTIVRTHMGLPSPHAGSMPLATVRKSQEAFVSADRCAALVNIDDLPHTEDGVHFAPAPTDLIGQREFDALQSILARQGRAHDAAARLPQGTR